MFRQNDRLRLKMARKFWPNYHMSQFIWPSAIHGPTQGLNMRFINVSKMVPARTPGVNWTVFRLIVDSFDLKKTVFRKLDQTNKISKISDPTRRDQEKFEVDRTWSRQNRKSWTKWTVDPRWPYDSYDMGHMAEVYIGGLN